MPRWLLLSLTSAMPRWLLLSLTFAGLFPLRRRQLLGSCRGREGGGPDQPAGSPAPLRPPLPRTLRLRKYRGNPLPPEVRGSLPEGAPWSRAPLGGHLEARCGPRTREERAAGAAATAGGGAGSPGAAEGRPVLHMLPLG
ncbi:small membrane A-kinase anchor protein isoform X1 [Pan paniscus]|uniref:small membrane A-kinase anchor protein isoform X1 n=1 Tax=Pan paniscus TaxID=9597 RepID=UPI003003C6A6